MSGQMRMWLRLAVDYGALIAFAGAFLYARLHHNPEALIFATPVLMVGSVIAVGAGYLIEKRFAPLPTLYGAFALVFGSLTLIFHDKSFVKMKPTFAYGAFAAALAAGLVLKRNPLKALMGEQIRMPDAAWRTLTVRYLVFFVLSAIANEAVWRTQSDARWIIYKLIFIGVILVFSVAQTPFLMKHMESPAPVTPEPPDPGF